ncbi:hypothetical protein M0804_006778 [Polistes exclamans]|nr:hypothetical protein M0804_006778 [Polistes exclamans]
MSGLNWKRYVGDSGLFHILIPVTTNQPQISQTHGFGFRLDPGILQSLIMYFHLWNVHYKILVRGESTLKKHPIPFGEQDIEGSSSSSPSGEKTSRDHHHHHPGRRHQGIIIITIRGEDIEGSLSSSSLCREKTSRDYYHHHHYGEDIKGSSSSREKTSRVIITIQGEDIKGHHHSISEEDIKASSSFHLKIGH